MRPRMLSPRAIQAVAESVTHPGSPPRLVRRCQRSVRSGPRSAICAAVRGSVDASDSVFDFETSRGDGGFHRLRDRRRAANDDDVLYLEVFQGLKCGGDSDVELVRTSGMPSA